MAETRMSSKGQVVVPKNVRKARGWAAGTRFTVEDHPEGVLLKPSKTAPDGDSWDAIFSSLKYDGPPLSIEDMDRAITEEVKARLARGRY